MLYWGRLDCMGSINIHEILILSKIFRFFYIIVMNKFNIFCYNQSSHDIGIDFKVLSQKGSVY